jgi:hypothetical protein
MKKSLFATAVLASVAFMPSSAFANYYSYNRCVQNGGGYFGCLGELADVSIAAPEVEKQFGFVKEVKDGEDRVMESLKALSGTCDKAEKGEARLACYRDGLKKSLGEK